MVRERKHQELRCWMEQAIRSGIPELARFVAGIEREYDAVHGLMADFGESGQESCQCDHWLPRLHFGGNPPASSTEGALRRGKFAACRQLPATWKPAKWTRGSQ